MSTENSEPIKTLEEWIKRVKELEEKLDLAPYPWPFPPPTEPELPSTDWDNWKPIE